MTLESFKKGIANDLRNALVRSCPVDTGALKNSITVEIENDELVINMFDYGEHVEYGTKPHIIRPKDAKALRFKKGTKVIYAKEVHHPGTRPQPFIRNTFHHKLPKIIERNAFIHLNASSVEIEWT